MITFILSCEYMRKHYYFKNKKFRREAVKILLQPEFKIKSAKTPF